MQDGDTRGPNLNIKFLHLIGHSDLIVASEIIRQMFDLYDSPVLKACLFVLLFQL